MIFSRICLFIIAFSLAAGSGLFAEVRSWKNTATATVFKATFVKRDPTSVTLRDESGRERAFEISKLHKEDQGWLEVHHPLTDSGAIFDTLTFADTRETAFAKLKASQLVEMVSDETFFGRSGINGAFRTEKKINNLSVYLYFDWTETGTLKELTLQTEDQVAGSFKTALEPSWKEFIELLSSLYGEPVQKGNFPSILSLQDGALLPTHLWKLEGGGSVLLGTSREGEKYQVCVRFSQQAKRLVEIP
jgi:hypothetical protein